MEIVLFNGAAVVPFVMLAVMVRLLWLPAAMLLWLNGIVVVLNVVVFRLVEELVVESVDDVVFMSVWLMLAVTCIEELFVELVVFAVATELTVVDVVVDTAVDGDTVDAADVEVDVADVDWLEVVDVVLSVEVLVVDMVKVAEVGCVEDAGVVLGAVVLAVDAVGLGVELRV